MNFNTKLTQLEQLIKDSISAQGYLSARAVIKQDTEKPEVYWITASGISASDKLNLKARYKLTLNEDLSTTLKFQHCSPRMCSHDIERVIKKFKF